MSNQFQPLLDNRDYQDSGVKKQNVISLSKWKLQKEKGIEFQRYQNYLSILHHNDLINEVKFIVNQLESITLDLEMINNAKLLLTELASRLLKTSKEMSDVIKLMISNLEKLIESSEL